MSGHTSGRKKRRERRGAKEEARAKKHKEKLPKPGSLWEKERREK